MTLCTKPPRQYAQEDSRLKGITYSEGEETGDVLVFFVFFCFLPLSAESAQKQRQLTTGQKLSS